jgi:ABC-type xylose transport system substrate-binding protein
VIEHRLRDVRRWTPETARAHLDAALSSVATALDALHAEHTHRTTEQEQS